MKNLLAVALISLTALSFSGCSSQSTSHGSLELSSAAVDPRESAKCDEDDRPYKGISCFDVRLGISLARFRELVEKKETISQMPTKFPSILRKYSIESFPGSPMPWSASAHFLLDQDCYRLYTVDGFSPEPTSKWVEYFSKSFGRPVKDGLAYTWSRGGTKLRVLDGDQPLISFTHDELIEESSAKMAEVMARGE